MTEGADAEFEVSLGAESELEVTVSYATADDTADEDDYTSASGTLTFEAGDRAKTITVTTEDDDLDEAASEQFKLTLSSADNATLFGGQATLEKLGKIEDNDDPPVLSLEDVTVTEGADAEFEVSLGAESELEVTVSYATADDTADEDDYTSASGTLTFEAGDRAKTITVTTEDDDLDEAASEQFKLTLSSAGNATLDGDQATLEKLGKIEDNDDPPVLSLEDVTVTEGADVEFEVSLGAASELEVTVSYATADDTADEDDYTSASGTLTFEAGDRAKTITVTTEDDDLDEAASEQFKLTLSSADERHPGRRPSYPARSWARSKDNDNPPVLSLEDVTVTEGADVEFEVSLGAASELEVTVSYATADDTADEDDYTSASGTLTFEAGDRAKTITVTTEDDDLDEAASEQFKLTLSSAANATLDGDQATLEKLGKIEDNDDPPVLSLADVTVTEGADAEFEVSLGAASELEVTVSYATADDTADEDDYTSASGTLTFEAGDRAKTITVTTEDDDLDEAASEQFKLTLSSAANATLDGDQATLEKLGKIEDNDDPPVLSLADVTVTEGADAEFEVSLGAASELEVTVSYATADDTADEDDYTSASGTLTFEAGDRAKTITVTTEDDDLDEAASEQFKLTLSSAGNATLDGDQATLEKLGKIEDNDDPPVLSLADVTVTEGADVEFEVSLGAASELEVTVSYATADDTADEDDYTSASGTLTFEAGDLAKTITVTTEDDDLDEAASEQFKLTLSSADNATLFGGQATLEKLGKIEDNDDPPVLSLEDVTVTEGADVEFEVSLGAASELEVTVSYATADDTADEDDYTSASGTLTFEAGDLAKTITVMTEDDDLDEAASEQFKLTLSSAANATLFGGQATLEKLGKIEDNDNPPVLSLEDVTVTEGANAEFEVSLGAESELEVTVSYATADDTADEDDYTSASGTLTFEAGDRAKTITVTTEDDDLDEAASEQFKLTLSSADNATLFGGQATLEKLGKIEDNDDPPVLSLEDVTVTEGADVEFEVSLGAESELEVTVSYATTDDTADEDDYTSASGTLTFEAGDRAKTITVTTEDDDLDEAASEQFKLTLSSAGNATLFGGQATLQKLGKITDNDGAPVLSLADVTVTEGADAEFEVSLGAASELEVTVSYATADDTADEDDYTSASGTLTFEAGDRAKTITVTTEDDDLDEAASEQFKLTLSSAANATLFGGQATLQKLGKIEDNDDPPVLSLADVTVTEGADVEFEVSLGAESELEVTVSYATADDTADEDDYTSASGTLTFEAGDRAKTITVTTEDDDLDEAASEQFKLTLSSADNATLFGGQATLQKLGKIEDNDDPPVLSLEDVTVTEGADVEFEVSLGAESGREVTVSYGTTDDTAKQPGDYTTASGTLTFAAGDQAKTITVTTEDDTVDEEDTEQFKLTLSSAGNATLDGDQTTLQRLGKIEDNDEPSVLSLEDVTVTEGTDAEFEVSLDAASERQVLVTYGTADDTAEQPHDYTAASGTLTFEAGDRAKTITVTTENDTLDEENTEQFKLTLSGANNATLSGGEYTLQKLGKIEDNDDPPVLSVGDETVTEGAAAEFAVSLDAESARQVTVSYATSDDTAEEPDDYTDTSGSLTFAAGDRTKIVTVATSTDSLNEANETFKVTLSNPGNATLDADNDEADGTIEDDDELTAAVAADAPTVDEDASATFTVTLTGATSTDEVVIDYSLVGSATENDDYTASSGKLTIEAKLGSGQLTIKTREDNVLDRNETLEVRLDSATSAGSVAVSTTTAETRIIDSNTVKVTVTPAVFVEDDPNTEPDESQDSSVVEEGTTATFTVALSGAVGVEVLVPYTTVDGSALAGADKDYTANGATLAFAPSEISKTVEIVTRDDGLSEVAETFEVRLTATPTSLPEGVTVTTASATGTITDNDTLTAAVTADNPTVTEDQSATFTVTLTGATSTAEVVVDYSLVGTATEGDDYTAPSGKLTIGSPLTSGQIAIKTLQDDLLDRGETLEVRLVKASTDGTATVNRATAETTITDPGTVQVSVTGLTVNEGDPPVKVDKSSVEEGEPSSFVVTLSGPVQKTVEVSYVTSDGTGSDAATAGTDYTEADVKLTFASKETSKIVAVTTAEDTDNEANETFTVTLTSVTLPDGVSLDIDATMAPGTIENDDGLTATVKRVADNVPEGDPAEFAVELTGGTSTADVEVTYTWDSTGTAGTDYTAPSGLLTITKPNSSGTIAIATLTDSLLDPGEILSVTLTDADTAIGTATVGTPATATTTIAEEGTVTVSVKAEEVEDDDSTPNVDEYDDKSIVEEGASARFIVELSGAAAETVIVGYATSNETGAGHATAGTDYTAVSNTFLTFTSGQSLTQPIAVTTADDNFNEPTEKFTVTLTGQDLPDLVSIGTSSKQGTITDNDDLTAAVTALATSVDEGNTAEFAVTLTGGTSTAPVLVSYTVGGTATSGEDYTAPTDLTLTIGTGDTSGTISIKTLTDTVLDGDDETLEITLGSASSIGNVSVSSTPASMSISDTTETELIFIPEGATASRTHSAARSAAFLESDTATRLTAMQQARWVEGQPVRFRMALSGVTEIEHTPVVAEYDTSNDAAVAPDDYTATSGTLTFSIGDYPVADYPRGAVSTEPVNIETNDDSLNEAPENFAVTLTTKPGSHGVEKTLRGPATILDNDPINVRLSASPTSVPEGETVRFTVTLSGATSTEAVTIRYTVSGDVTQDDYFAPSGTLIIGTGSTSGTFTIQTDDDEELEPAETMQVTADGTSAGVVGSDSATVTITDNDSLSVSLEAPLSTVTEGESASFVVKLSGATPSDLVVSYATSNGMGAAGAEAGLDYNQASGTLTFSVGSGLTQTFTVATIDDKLNEATETFTVTLDDVSLPVSVDLGVTDAVVGILDNDALTASVMADADIVAEGDPATFTVTLMPNDVMSTGDVLVTYTVGGSAKPDDYTTTDPTLTIGEGEPSGTITIETMADDEREPDGELTVTLVRAEPENRVMVDMTPATTMVIDPPAVTIGDASAAESVAAIMFEVKLSAGSPRQVTVSYDTEDGTAEAGEDYTKANGTLTFAAMVEVATISIALRDDRLDEDDETFTVRLSDPMYGRLGDTGITATGTIIDDDDPPSISIHDASAKESAGAISFRVSLNAASGREVAVSYRTEDSTAKAGEDYGATDGTLTIAAGRTAATIRVTLENDFLEEEEETFTVRLLDPVNAELADPTATGTIIDDDVSVAQVWLARFGRTVATHVVDAVGERLNEAAGRSFEAAIAGHPLQPAPIPEEWQESTPIPYRTLVGHELVAGSSFRLASSGDEDEAAGGGSKWTGWGRGAVTRLAGKEPKADLSLRGTIATGTAGVDYDWGGVLTGLAMAYTGGGGNFQTDEPYLEPRSGMAESWLLSAHPYARVSVVDGLEVWGLLGYGLGMMTLTEDASVNTDIRLMMGAAGVRGILLTPMANGGFGVAVSTDGFAMRANADAAGHQPAVEADAVRGRLLVEGSYDAQLGDGSVLTPIVEAGMRYDAGHAEEGFGAELGGGVRYVKPEWGLTATANGRFVLAHQDRGFQEWGLRGSLQWSPGAGGLGPSLGVNTSVGTAASGVQRLWSQGATPIPAAPESDAPAGRLDAQLGYGMSVDLLGTNARLTPYAGLTLADGGTQAYRVGGRANLGSSFSLSLEGQRRESSGNAPAHGITLSGSLHW